jgi:ATP-dependent RNA helicase DDX24/MAK5
MVYLTVALANSINCIRRIVSLFTLLGCHPLPLHASMAQRQRLKNVDRFTARDNSLLVASDVAARGLDIPNIQHVVHYQVPRTSETYIHRSGRTARAEKQGVSVVLVSPQDMKLYQRICHNLNKVLSASTSK